jgi:hypothetical protein
MPTLSILMPALAHRPWQVAWTELNRQASRYGNGVELSVEVDSGEATSGVKRQRLLDRSHGDFVCYVDDDDRLDPEYLDRIWDGIARGADLVTFDLELTRSDRPRHRELWRYGLHAQDRRRGQMTANHLCVWRRDLATRVSWCPELGYADDQLWYQPIYYSLKPGDVKEHYHVDRVLYRYTFDPRHTVNTKPDRINFSRRYVGAGLGCWIDPDDAAAGQRGVLVEVGGLNGGVPIPLGCVRVRDRRGATRVIRTADYPQFHTIKIA